ncbi:tRNA (adenine(37)-N6)-methyltransferase [Vombatus ursinus]|uniref:tRNA (adenine(37)-N6)-methyltransferase n=1 Tax=Vombatus ursinus TaxID=29139 RepID=A0A4X2L216_VOMUR|nr:tRNA (adenine(37)-N6)-methyltransferase [Vombatus ursinus]XP_027714876.1 tRNA (adenine(37)-N6)-methyltransferase [Vombatus ursinus]XP_027714877.1 tRNA (adenine(37)-N6)-methyltransferase [Vombatus ursinus]XP_027714879.1 tRNA (adenine(37)-N6)-methyltransferase [Vombatus ursinus]
MQHSEEPSTLPASTCGCMKPALETGNILTEPIGYIESCFSAKNGTPRQPTICSLSRACLRIRKSVFNNPEHSVMGLEQFSHVWILFVFHKNGHLSCKAKVQPPRLNGTKIGIFSTRSPHRPNAIGLTLAKLDKVEGGAIYLSGIDMINGTPVLDIKPYIADYDSPQDLMEPLDELNLKEREQKQRDLPHSVNTAGRCERQQGAEGVRPQYHSTEGKHPEDQTAEGKYLKDKASAEGKCPFSKCRSTTADCVLETRTNQSSSREGGRIDLHWPKEGIDNRLSVVEGDAATQENSSGTQHPSSMGVSSPASCVPSWVKDSPVTTLEVRFTPHAEMDLEHFSSEDHTGINITSFKYFRSVKEAKCAIIDVLAADPRSVYRRKHCQDRLFYFSMDTAHITCWFGDGFAEVLRIKHNDTVENTVGQCSLQSASS